MKTVAERMGRKLFQCCRCNAIKKAKFIGTYDTDRRKPTGPVCKKCLKPPEVVPTPNT